MKNKKLVYKILMIVLISVLLAGAATFLLLEVAGLPNCDIDSRKEAITKFTACFDGINAVLEPYGLRAVPDAPWDFGEVVDENDEYELFAYVYLEDGESLYISLNWEYGDNADFYLSLEGPPCNEAAECSLDTEQYPYVYEIAEYLCDGRFSAKQFQASLSAAKEQVEKELNDEYSTTEWRYLESALFTLGWFQYDVERDHETDIWNAEISINMDLYE